MVPQDVKRVPEPRVVDGPPLSGGSNSAWIEALGPNKLKAMRIVVMPNIIPWFMKLAYPLPFHLYDPAQINQRKKLKHMVPRKGVPLSTLLIHLNEDVSYYTLNKVIT